MVRRILVSESDFPKIIGQKFSRMSILIFLIPNSSKEQNPWMLLRQQSLTAAILLRPVLTEVTWTVTKMKRVKET